jgi:hypothetical protein
VPYLLPVPSQLSKNMASITPSLARSFCAAKSNKTMVNLKNNFDEDANLKDGVCQDMKKYLVSNGSQRQK